MALLGMDERFLCMPLPYHHEVQLEEPPIRKLIVHKHSLTTLSIERIVPIPHLCVTCDPRAPINLPVDPRRG